MTNIRDKVLEAVDVEWFDKDHVLLCCIKYMSEYDIRSMMKVNDLLLPEDCTDEDNDINEL